MTLTTTVVNAHALSHLFEDEISAVELCDTCEEFTLTTNDVIIIPAQETLDLFQKPIVDSRLSPFFFFESPALTLNYGQYFNKPPPFELV